jgi:hypothetical protein
MAPPSNVYPSDPSLPIADAGPPLGAPSSPEIDVADGAAAAPIALPPVATLDSALIEPPAATPVSPNPSDPGAESTEPPRIDLVPEPGIAMAAASSDGEARSTEIT